MRRTALAFLICPLLAGSAIAQGGGEPLDAALKQALLEQSAAEMQTAKLERVAAQAQNEADRLHAQQVAAAEAIEAAEARINTANARVELASVYVAHHQQQLAAEQQPISSLLAGLATMARRPPLLALADHGGADELVKVRLLLDSTLPVIRSRTSKLAGQLTQGQRLQQTAVAAKAELARSRDNLDLRRRHYSKLEEMALEQALSSTGQALGTSDVAIAAQEDVSRLRSEQSNNESIRAVAGRLASGEAAPPSPFKPEGAPVHLPLAYELPAAAVVTEGLEAVNASGVRSRGLTLATPRGASVVAPADGIIKFSGPFRDYDGILIIDHGGGWLSLIVNVGSQLHAGDRVRLGDEVGRALGPLLVELSQNGRRFSPALIAGSSQRLSKAPKGG